MRIVLASMVAAAATLSAPAAAATRTYSVTDFDHVRVLGPYAVTLTTDRFPGASASGGQRALDSVSVEVQGRTLIIRAAKSGWGGYPGEAAGPVTLTVATHDLVAASLVGNGSLAIDRVKGLSFDLVAQGAGAASIDRVAVDQFKLVMGGTTTVRLAGEAPKFNAIVRGTGTLDAAGLKTKDSALTAIGPAVVKANASNSATVTANGIAAITLDGRPACTLKMGGSASVTGCR